MSKGNEAESSQQGDKEADPAPHLEAGQSLIAEEKAQSELPLSEETQISNIPENLNNLKTQLHEILKILK